MEPLDLFVTFVRERENIRLKKEAAVPRPWTADEILRTFRFCNIRREDDRVTRWIAKNWRDPNASDPDVWFAMAVARHVNLPDTLDVLTYPVPWNPKRFVRAIRNRKTLKLTAYNAAYMIRASAGPDWEDKAEYLSKAVLSKLWKRREELRPVVGDTLEAFHGRLQNSFGLGSFMAAQIVADVKYVGVLSGPLGGASDWWEFAASGPGSRRGLNRLLGREPKSHWKEKDWREELAKLRSTLRPQFQELRLPWCHAQDTQNQLCEYSKYMKAYTGEGRPKQRYAPEAPSVLTEI